MDCGIFLGKKFEVNQVLFLQVVYVYQTLFCNIHKFW